MNDQARLFSDPTLFSDFGDNLDFWETPKWAVELLLPLLPKEEQWSVLEPAAGRGAILEVLRSELIGSFFACELSTTRFTELTSRFPAVRAVNGNFFEQGALVSDWSSAEGRKLIPMNPPYSKPDEGIGERFTVRCLELAQAVSGVVAALLPLDFAHGASRTDNIHRRFPGSLYPFRTRPSFNGGGSGQRPFAWFVWDTLDPKQEWKVIG